MRSLFIAALWAGVAMPVFALSANAQGAAPAVGISRFEFRGEHAPWIGA